MSAYQAHSSQKIFQNDEEFGQTLLKLLLLFLYIYEKGNEEIKNKKRRVAVAPLPRRINNMLNKLENKCEGMVEGVKRIVNVDSIDDYLKRNDEKTIIDKVCEESAEDGVLSDMELEQIHEEMVDDLYKRQLKEKKEYAYKFIAEHIWNAAHNALEEGNLAESIAIGDVYNEWVDVCIKAGVV